MSTREAWTEEQKKYLIDNHYKSSPEDIADHINRDLRSVKNMATVLGLNNKIFGRHGKGLLKIKYQDEIIRVASISSIDDFVSSLKSVYHMMRQLYYAAVK